MSRAYKRYPEVSCCGFIQLPVSQRQSLLSLEKGTAPRPLDGLVSGVALGYQSKQADMENHSAFEFKQH